MDREKIIDELIPIFKETLENDDLTIRETDSSETIDGWDSLIHILLISEIESHFGIKIPVNQIQNMKSVSAMVDVIVELTTNS